MHAGFLVSVTLAGLISFPLAIADEPSGPSAESVAELMRATGAGAMAEQMMGLMIQQLSPLFPNVPQALWRELQSELDGQEITRLLVPVYQRHLTSEEVDSLIEFFNTPVGRSFIQKQPIIAQESMMVGNAWGQQMADKLIRKLKERGYDPVSS